MISGKPVKPSIDRTVSPASRSCAAVPPVETSSTPRAARPRANSTTPVLSDTDSSARRIRTSPGCVTSDPPSGRDDSGSRLHPDVPRIARIEPHRAAGDPADGGAEQLVLVGAQRRLDLRRVARVRKIDGALGDDRPRVDPRVDEVDR